MRRSDPTPTALRMASLAGLAFLALGAAFAEAARAHMAAVGHICGGATPHCAACYAAAASVLAAAVPIASAVGLQFRPVRTGPRR